MHAHATTSFSQRKLHLQFLIFRNLLNIENFQKGLKNYIIKLACERLKNEGVYGLTKVNQFSCKTIPE